MALLAGSPAIDAADQTVCAAAPASGVDQRGFVRGTACDMGAYEFGASPPTAAPATAVPTLSDWGVPLASTLLALSAILTLRRRRTKPVP